jgi:hypothetical protein
MKYLLPVFLLLCASPHAAVPNAEREIRDLEDRLNNAFNTMRLNPSLILILRHMSGFAAVKVGDWFRHRFRKSRASCLDARTASAS